MHMNHHDSADTAKIMLMLALSIVFASGAYLLTAIH
jgi:hypothetical protein